MSNSNKNLDVISMAVAAVENTNNILKAMAKKYDYGKALPKDLPSSLPLTVPHTLFYGPGGVGKTRSVEEAVKLMNCSEDRSNFIRLTPDSFNNAKEFVDILEENLSWDGYLCDQGKINHDNCNGCTIVDPINPRGPIKQTAVFIDEIHAIDKTTQVGLLLILHDFRYQFRDETGTRDVYFPKFTCFGATTDPGLLSKPLRTRFKYKVSIGYKTDEEMVSIIGSIAQQRRWTIEQGAMKIIAKCSQGIPREAINHMDGLFACWCYNRREDEKRAKEGLEPVLSKKDRECLTEELTHTYINTMGFVPDGLSYDQIKLLNFLDKKTDSGKYITAGIKKILDSMGWDEQRYADEVEPRLVHRGYLDTTRARRITQEGVAYLKEIINKYPNILSENKS